jgi:creatinine amidohydrolase
MSVYRLEELTSPALDGLDRARTVILLTASPLEEHGPHLPLGVDALSARHYAEAIAERLTALRPGWSAVLTPTLHVGSYTFHAPGTITVRQRAVRDLLVDYGSSLARAGFRYILVLNGHGGPTHLVALEEASAIVSRRYKVTMASPTGHLAWDFLRGRYLGRVEAALGRSLTPDERQAYSDDAHGGWFETSLMLMLRPDLVDPCYRTLPPARYSLAARLRPNYPLRDGGQGYVGHPALADPLFAKATLEVLLAETMELVERLLDGTVPAAQRRSPFFAVPVFRTNFWGWAGATAGAIALTLLAVRNRRR